MNFKKLTSSILLVCCCFFAMAQICTSCIPIFTSGCKPTGGLCNKPGLGMANQPYSTSITFFMPKKLTDAVTLSSCQCTSVDLKKIKITGIGGLPAGADNYLFNKTQAPFKGYYDIVAGDSIGCVTICGTPLAPGLYPIEVFITADVYANGTPIGGLDPGPQYQKYIDTIIILPDTSGSVSSFTFGGIKEDCDSVKLNLNATLSAPSPNPTRYFWDINGTKNSTKTPGFVSFNSPGTYKVALKTVYYKYYIKKFHINNMTNSGAWRGDVEELVSGDPDVYIVSTGLGLTTKSTPVDNSTNFDLNIPIANGTFAMGADSFAFQLWDYDNGTAANTPISSKDDFLGNYSVAISSFPFFPFDVNFSGSNSQGYVRFDTIVGTVIVDTLIVTIKGRPILPTILTLKDSICNGDSTLLTVTPGGGAFKYAWFKNDTTTLAGIDSSIYFAKEEANFKVLVTDKTTGCSTLSLNKKVSQFDTAPEGIPIYFDQGTQKYFLNGVPIGFKTKWYFNGNEVSGESSEILSVDLGPGIYNALIYNPKFPICAAYSLIDTVLVNGIQNDNRNGIGKVTVLPNPNNGKFIIQLSSVSETNLILAISDVVGREILSKNIVSSGIQFKEVVDLTDVNKGVYFVTLRNAQRKSTSRIVID